MFVSYWRYLLARGLLLNSYVSYYLICALFFLNLYTFIHEVFWSNKHTIFYIVWQWLAAFVRLFIITACLLTLTILNICCLSGAFLNTQCSHCLVVSIPWPATYNVKNILDSWCYLPSDKRAQAEQLSPILFTISLNIKNKIYILHVL